MTTCRSATERQVSLFALVCVWLAACGGLDDSAPTQAPVAKCVTVETRLQPLVDLANQGRLKHIALLVQHDVDEPSQRALVRLVLAIGAALPPGSAHKLPKLVADPNAANIGPLLVALLGSLPGQPDAQPPVPPQTDEMAAFSAIVRSCHPPELFQAMTGLLREPDLPGAVDLLLGASAQAGPQLRQGLKAAGVQGRPGFMALVRDALTSIAAPGFEVQPLLNALQGLADPQHPGAIDALALLLRRVGEDHEGKPTPLRIQAIQGLAACILKADPQDRVAGHLYDVLLTPAAPTEVALPHVPTPTATGPSQTGELLALAAFVTEVLAADEAAREALAQVLGLILRPDLATAAIPELLDLVQSQALIGVIALLGDLIEQPCRSGADQ